MKWVGAVRMGLAAMEKCRRHYRFRRAQRIRSSADFDRIFKRRCSVHVSALGLYIDANGLGFARLGVRIGKRAGRATQRVQARRRLREAFRRIQHELPPMDYIAVIRTTTQSSAEYEEILAQLAPGANKKFLAMRSTS